MSVIVGILTVVPVVIKVVLDTVQIDEYGYFTRNGKALINKKTGLVKLAPPSNYPYWVFPLVRQLRKVSTKRVTIDPVTQTLATSDNITLTISMTASYILRTDEESLTISIIKVENPTSEMYNIVTNVVTSLVSEMTYNEVRDVERFRTLVLERCNLESCTDVGAEFTHVRFQTFAKTEAQLHSDGLEMISRSIESRDEFETLFQKTA